MSPPRSALLVDASIYLYRGWHHWPASTIDRAGRPSNALAGLADTLVDLLARERPALAVCALDTCGRSGTRNRLYPAYKRSRPPVPPVLLEQLARARDLVPRLGVATFGSERVEADDIVGHFANVSRAAGHPVTVVSGDKDLAQFVLGRGDVYLDAGRQPKRDARALERRLGVPTAAVADWLALCGDRSDDIPGVPGVGPAISARLIRKWGSLDVLYANLSAVPAMRFRGAPGVATLLAEHEPTVRLARRLTGLLDDPSLPVGIDALTRRPVDVDAVREALLDAGLAPHHAEERAESLLVADTA
mgnify:CR=1 FL=1